MRRATAVRSTGVAWSRGHSRVAVVTTALIPVYDQTQLNYLSQIERYEHSQDATQLTSTGQLSRVGSGTTKQGFMVTSLKRYRRSKSLGSKNFGALGLTL